MSLLRLISRVEKTTLVFQLRIVECNTKLELGYIQFKIHPKKVVSERNSDVES